jgi:His-Xaa-Ser system protein HxsD
LSAAGGGLDEALMEAGAEIVEITFDQATVGLDALQRAAYALTNLMTVDIGTSGDRYVCRLFPRHPAADAHELGHRMRAEVIDQTLRTRIAAETEPLRNLIFALAFSQTGLAEDETAQPDETTLPDETAQS